MPTLRFLPRSVRAGAALLLFAMACGGEGPFGPQGATTDAIVNGTNSPSLVSLTYGQQQAIGFLTLDPAATPFCSGTLIAPNVVLTAFHCIKDRDPTTVQFGIGTPGSPTTTIQSGCSRVAIFS